MGNKRHTLVTAQAALQTKGLSGFLSIKSLDYDTNTAVIVDRDYGEYRIDLKGLAPKTNTALHKLRRHKLRLAAMKAKFIGIRVNGMEITDLFYGPDRGYKNRSFYITYLGLCGHEGTSTYATLTKHKKNLICFTCAKTEHGARKQILGVLPKRTSTYNHWVAHKQTLPEPLRSDYTVFRDLVGDKPAQRADLNYVDGKYVWVTYKLSGDIELQLIAVAIRQAFRRSSMYKRALNAAKVEHEGATRYQCAACKQLFPLASVQVDHIDPIENIDGTPLTKEGLIDRIVTDKIQVLDKACHTRKSTEENRLRREAKKRRQRKV